MAPMAADIDVQPVPTVTAPVKAFAAAYPFFTSEPAPLRTPAAAAAAPPASLGEELAGFYSESIAAKLWKVALEQGEPENGLMTRFPEHVPAHGAAAGRYATREARFWTCGFFPGSLWAVVERSVRFPRAVPVPAGLPLRTLRTALLQQARRWAAPLHVSALRTNTHDLGFITQPALRTDWELTGNPAAWASLERAAHNLASRFDPRMQAVRSWDTSFSRRYEITDMETNFMVIVDSMCNLDLLFYVSHHTGDARLRAIATAHARFVARHLIRPDQSTWHVANFDPRDGRVKRQYTHQGYSDDSCWSRGQAWTILGFAQTYTWTRDPVFLATAVRLADYFLARLASASHAHPYVPVWDFDAPPSYGPEGFDPTAAGGPLRDASAAMIAANGLLLLHAALRHRSPYLEAALRIARETQAMCLPADQGRFVVEARPVEERPAEAVAAAASAAAEASAAAAVAAAATTELEAESTVNGAVESAGSEAAAPQFRVEGVTFDALLTHATANCNPWALVRYGDHGLVYADYFFVEFGNKLLRMGLV